MGLGFYLCRGLLYGDVDGVLALTLIRDAGLWGSPWAQSHLSHLQGMGAQQLPGNVWINPGYAVLLQGASPARVIASYLIFAGALFTATHVLGRTLRLGTTTTVVASQIACLLPFPPLERWAGIHPQLQLNPGVAYYVAIALVVLAILLRFGGAPAAWVPALIALVPLLLLYSILCDPLWTVVPFLSLGVFFGAALLVERSRRADLFRIASIGGALGLLLALGVPQYLAVLFGYTARVRFRAEIVGEVQNTQYAFLPFRNLEAAALFAVLLGGALMALRHREGAVRLFARAALAHMVLLLLLSAIYLFTDINWTYPLPAYFEQAALPVYVLVALAGWVRGIGRVLRPLPALLQRPWAVVVMIPLAGVLLTGVRVVATPPEAIPPGVDFLKLSWHAPLEPLRDRVVTRPGELFRGSVVTYFPDYPLEAVAAAQATLWAMEIPTLEEYSQTLSPPLYYLASRALGGPRDGPHGRNRLQVRTLRPALLRALGVRFLLASRSAGNQLETDPTLTLRDLSEVDGYRVFELARPNVGTYSPTRVLLARTAREMTGLLSSPDVDLERDVVLAEPVGGALVPAAAASMRLTREGVRITARSAGTSLLLVPLQFSHALQVRAARGEARLIRANLVQTGVLFTDEIDIDISLAVGIGRHAGRKQDLTDLDTLGIAEDGSRISSPEAFRRLHPHAWISLRAR